MVSRRVYFVLAALGAIVPYTALAVFISRHGLDLAQLAQQAFGSPGAVFFALDVVLCGVAVLISVLRDLRDPGAKWAVTAATLVIGPSCGLPLWLALRQAADKAER
ncbi:DUF2834 domain-containing protein [Actinoplanes sp. DH11]|uniref:DUF2834 domain-containing protein n=1 Tax=Actinoplanes sp. DH11 TaxID=2857011 RepID=UPI001E5B1F29|nr:DUF2834 domain-containing protein [Actinoplanes sp. DH11]